MAPHHAPRHNGFAVRDFRVAAGMSVDELAQRTLISSPHIRNIENENREPSRLHLRKIAEVLACRVNSLVRDPSLLSDDAAPPFPSSATPPAPNTSDDGTADARANDAKPPTDLTASSERASA